MCYVAIDKEQLGKLDTKSDKAMFLGYSTTSRAYRVFNKRTKIIIEYINVVVDDVEADETTRLDEGWLLEFHDDQPGDQVDSPTIIPTG